MLAAAGKRSARRNVLSRVQRTGWACQRESERGEVGELGAGKENKDAGQAALAQPLFPDPRVRCIGPEAESQPPLCVAPDFLGLPASLLPQTLTSRAGPAKETDRLVLCVPNQPAGSLSVFRFVSPLPVQVEVLPQPHSIQTSLVEASGFNGLVR